MDFCVSAFLGDFLYGSTSRRATLESNLNWLKSGSPTAPPSATIDIDPRFADARTKRKLIRRKLQAKIALERGPTASDELVITVAIIFAAAAKRAARLNGVRIQLREYIERYGLGYGRWFFLHDIAKETKIMRRIGSVGRLVKRILRAFERS